MKKKAIKPENLSKDQKLFLGNLSNQLSKIEKNKIIEFGKLNARVADLDDWVTDYEINFNLTFFLDKTDPEYDENKENVLIKILDRSLYPNAKEKLKENIYSGYPMDGREQCGFYHILYSNPDFGLSEMLRIGHIEAGASIRIKKSTINLT